MKAKRQGARPRCGCVAFVFALEKLRVTRPVTDSRAAVVTMDYDQLILAGIKFVVAPLFVLNLAHTLYAFLLRGPKKLRKYGEWAVVTGATDGIGKAYAFELAKHGLNVMLLSRTEAKLVEVEQELKAKRPNVQVRHLAVDFGKFDAAARAAVKKAIGDLDVGVCINNVGMSYSFTKFYHELTDEEVSERASEVFF